VVIITAFATDAVQLAILRFVLGIAEAGFFPGILLYITYWFRGKEQAKAVGLLMAALAIFHGHRCTGLHLDPRFHPLVRDSTAGAGSLSSKACRRSFSEVLRTGTSPTVPRMPAGSNPDEQAWLTGEIQRENVTRQKQGGHAGLSSVIADRRVWFLSFIYCMLVIALYWARVLAAPDHPLDERGVLKHY